jgi:hypothetical protein
MVHLLTITKMTSRLPESEWLRFGILLLVLLAVLQVVRLVSRINRSLVTTVFIIGTIGLFASWVHNRNEPEFLTPVVEAVAPFFPTKIRAGNI